MSGRRLRPKEVGGSFVEDMTIAHQLMVKHLQRVRVGGEHYALLQDLHAHLVDTIHKVTGEKAPWIFNSSTGPARPGE